MRDELVARAQAALKQMGRPSCIMDGPVPYGHDRPALLVQRPKVAERVNVDACQKSTFGDPDGSDGFVARSDVVDRS